MINILVADDERWIRKGIVRMIDRELLGVGEVYEAESAEEAYSVFTEHRPQIVLLDVMFHGANGLDLGDRIYQMAEDTIIIMISAYDTFDNARRAMLFRAREYLQKPVSKAQLNEVLAGCVKELKERENAGEETKVIEDTPDIPEIPTERTTEKAISEVMDRIRKEYDKKYSLSEMAAECGVTEAYFSNLFKKIAGLSPMNYVVKVKMDKACELISLTDYKMHQIASLVGYQDYQYFVKVFKKTKGETPGEYKQKLQKEMDE